MVAYPGPPSQWQPTLCAGNFWHSTPCWLGIGLLLLSLSFLSLGTVTPPPPAFNLEPSLVLRGRSPPASSSYAQWYAALPVPLPPPRTAVCMSGQMRTLNMEPSDAAYPLAWNALLVDAQGKPRVGSPREDLKGMTVAQSIVAHLYPALGDVDVFVAMATRGRPREPLVGDASVCESLRPPKVGAFLSCDLWSEFDLPLFNETSPLWSGYVMKNYKQGFLQQLYGMWRCHEAVKLREIATGVRYSHIVRIRPDIAVIAPVRVSHISELDFGSPDAPTILIADKTQCCCGNEDWLNVGERGPMEVFLERYAYLQALPPPAALKPMWDAEEYARASLVRFCVCLRTPGGPCPFSSELQPISPLLYSHYKYATPHCQG